MSVSELLLQNGVFSSVDVFFAEMLLKSFPEASDDMTCALCYLLNRSRQGHLAIKVPSEIHLPKPYEEYASKIAKGFEILPEKLVTFLTCEQQEPILTPICKLKDRFYLQKCWQEETFFIEQYLRVLKMKPSISLDLEQIKQKLSQAQDLLNAEQQAAILQASANSFSIIMGGPGTGKTYTAGHLIRIVWDSLNEVQKVNFKIALAAPTGKAAANLQKSLQSALKEYPLTKELTATTLHQLLHYKKQTFTPDYIHPLSADLILIDESSMLDAKLMGNLFSMVKSGARLILMGDPHQLPPVESGGLFTDLVASFPHTSILKKCIRTDLKTLLQFAQGVHAGDVDFVLQHLKEHHHKKEPFSQLILEAHEQFSFLNNGSTDYEKLLEDSFQFRILTPLKKGRFGAEQINQNILEMVLKKIPIGNQVVIPILITKNDYRLNLYNGDMGLLVKKVIHKDPDYPFMKEDLVYFSQGRQIPAVLLSHFDYAYSLTVHKSQGSEFNHVLLLLPEGSSSFGRQMLYTAITRAKKKLDLWGIEEELAEAVRTQLQRSSGVQERCVELISFLSNNNPQMPEFNRSYY